MWKKAIYRISAVAVIGTTVLLASEIAHADTRRAPLLKRTLITPPLVYRNGVNIWEENTADTLRHWGMWPAER
jgi:hypothetical protein